MESFLSDFYIGDNLHRIEVLASPFKSSQKIYVDNAIAVDYRGTLVNGHMFYDVSVENVPLVISIRDCGLCCECNIFLDNVSIIDGSKLDARKTQAQKNLDEGFSKYMLKYTGEFVRKTILFAIFFSVLCLFMVGFSFPAVFAGIVSYPIALIISVCISWSKQKSIIDKWFKQYQPWQTGIHSF